MFCWHFFSFLFSSRNRRAPLADRREISGFVKLFRKFEGGRPERGRQMRGGWAKFAIFSQ